MLTDLEIQIFSMGLTGQTAVSHSNGHVVNIRGPCTQEDQILGRNRLTQIKSLLCSVVTRVNSQGDTRSGQNREKLKPDRN